MCHGHPRHHPCSHTSITWHYCPAAMIDLETGYEEPCKNISYASAQPTNGDCPLQNCQFKAMGGSWTCCSCNQGPNTQGWCAMPMSRWEKNQDTFEYEYKERTCDHGCCKNCKRVASSRSSSPEMAFTELRKGSASRKFGYSSAARSHRRGSAFSLMGAFPPVNEEGVASSGGSTAGYKIDLDYGRKKPKASGKKGHKVRVH